MTLINKYLKLNYKSISDEYDTINLSKISGYSIDFKTSKNNTYSSLSVIYSNEEERDSDFEELKKEFKIC